MLLAPVRRTTPDYGGPEERREDSKNIGRGLSVLSTGAGRNRFVRNLRFSEDDLARTDMRKRASFLHSPDAFTG